MTDRASVLRDLLTDWVAGLSEEQLVTLDGIRRIYERRPESADDILRDVVRLLDELFGISERNPNLAENIERGLARSGRDIWAASFVIAHDIGADDRIVVDRSQERGTLSMETVRLLAHYTRLPTYAQSVVSKVVNDLAAMPPSQDAMASKAELIEKLLQPLIDVIEELRDELAAERLRQELRSDDDPDLPSQ